MRNKLYLECTSGISGDMTVAALLDLGADQKKLVRTLKSLPVKGFDIKISRVMKSGIDACDFDVLLDHDHGCIKGQKKQLPKKSISSEILPPHGKSSPDSPSTCLIMVGKEIKKQYHHRQDHRKPKWLVQSCQYTCNNT